MNDIHVRVIIAELRKGIKNKDWNKIEYVEGLLNMHTLDAIPEYLKMINGTMV